ncbi:MAG: fatty acid--CoA ligase [Deltaproteobacteria bacterium]|nr:fatty acid--CoA ligase [Deltaproteobacteria bacterium]
MPVRIIESTASAYRYPLLVKNILNTPLIYSPDQEIVYSDKTRYSYRTLVQRIGRLANALEKLGVDQGDTVAVMDWDSHRYLECFFAVPMMGAVLHTVNIRLSKEQLIYTINHAKDDIILVNADFIPLLESVKDRFQTVKKIILLKDHDQPPDTPLQLDGEYEAILAESDTEYDFSDFDENTMATTFYTTGTTGLPKGVYFSHRQLAIHTYATMAALCVHNLHATVTPKDVYMPLTPMFHVHAWGIPYVMTLMGTKQVYPGRYEPEKLLRLIEKERVTFSHCVPTILFMLLSNPVVKHVDLSGWKVVIGGAALSKQLCKAGCELGINVYAAYGLSETCPVLTVANLKSHMLNWDLDRQLDFRCRTGLPISDVQMKIVDVNGASLPHDGRSVGEILVRTPWLTQGYVNDPQRAEDLWQGGWLHTGDMGFIDPEGYLKITDRLKDIIKTGGEWISSLQLEDIITQHEAVSEAAVIGVLDEKWGERPLAVVVLKKEFAEKITEDDIRAFFMKFVKKGAIPKYGVPERVVFTDAIPKTSVGKIDKKTIRQQYA